MNKKNIVEENIILHTLNNPQFCSHSFFEKFGAGLDSLDELVKAKTVTIQNLLEILPAGMPDPTSQVYNKTMVVMACLLGIALIANFLVKPVDPKHHMKG